MTYHMLVYVDGAKPSVVSPEDPTYICTVHVYVYGAVWRPEELPVNQSESLHLPAREANFRLAPRHSLQKMESWTVHL